MDPLMSIRKNGIEPFYLEKKRRRDSHAHARDLRSQSVTLTTRKPLAMSLPKGYSIAAEAEKNPNSLSERRVVVPKRFVP